MYKQILYPTYENWMVRPPLTHALFNETCNTLRYIQRRVNADIYIPHERRSGCM